MKRKKEPKYYRIRASIFWSVVIVGVVVFIYLGGVRGNVQITLLKR